ncbi:ARM repeat-containing protein [Delitschia confertaspora ATCC 74209]|uniref:ARM repeat-containing protein n=1 Tax=Delitschia confertaspora ATCC 74209 TaxID=1513339 RepID=A0A9P4MNZ6_9PLEO|nr:ARM repeat-containing protein [Delitschia confertaspora ATCC 74209]
MAGLKRKSDTKTSSDVKSTSKKVKVDKPASKPSKKRELAVRPAKPSKKAKTKDKSDDSVESDTTEEDNGFYGFSANDDQDQDSSDTSEIEEVPTKAKGKKEKPEEKQKSNGSKDVKRSGLPPQDSVLAAVNAQSSKEAHAKQKALAKERKAAKPNADIIGRSKKIWERLRLKSHVPQDERKELLTELFEIVTGRVKDFVFKHDSVRVIQCALKYSTMEQRRMIAKELKGEYKVLAESRYAKFLIAKLLENGDNEIRDMIVSEFYGHVRQLINHPEAAWILDDTYRAVAIPKQKARLLREWYGPEFSIKGLATEAEATADLAAILKENPEKRKPIMEFLANMINQLIQKKLTGFTMLHDAMLQYFLACQPGTSEANEFLEHLKPDATLKEGEEPDNVDLLKNLAFTKSGSRLVSLAFAYGGAKDRKVFLRPYKDTIETMVYDQYAHHVLLAAMAVTDDTRLTSKTIFSELLPTGDTLGEKVLNLANDTRARTILLYPFAGDAKWLFPEGDAKKRLEELYAIRATTSKKDAKVRSLELAKSIEPQLLDAVTSSAAAFSTTTFGYQFMTEVLLGAPEVEPTKRQEALKAVAGLAEGLEPSDSTTRDALSSAKMKMFKTLVQGGQFDPQSKKVVPVEPRLGFADMFWNIIKDNLATWATGDGSFVIVGLLESEDFSGKDKVLKALKKQREALKEAANPGGVPVNGAADDKAAKKGRKGKPTGKLPGNAGARILLEKL